MNKNYSLKVFNNFDDKKLQTGWKNLQYQANIFPQMYYEWIQSWWKYNNKGKNLYVITVLDFNEEIVGIAPFCIVKQFGVKILQSIPVHFGDFYSFIVNNNNNSIYEVIQTHINSFKKWSYIKINLVRTNCALYERLMLAKYKAQHIENIIEADLSNISYDDYLMHLHRKVRGEYRRRLRKLEKLGNVDFIISSNEEDYIKHEEDFRRIYESRWKEIDKTLPGDKIYAYRKEALVSLSKQKKAVFVLLKLNNNLIAYRFGILHKDKYHDYKISFDPNYHKLGLGSIITGLLLKQLIDMKVHYLDHGVGDYSYKNDWSPLGNKIKVYNFHKFKKNPLAIILFKFENKYKAKLKKLMRR